jgi:tetratricopeptide (TPR) repeat protein
MKNLKVSRVFIILFIFLFSACSESENKYNEAIKTSRDGNYKKAIKIYNKLLSKKPDKPRYLNDYGWTLTMVDSIDKSIDVLEKAKEELGKKHKLLRKSIESNLSIAKTYKQARDHMNNEEPQKALKVMNDSKLYLYREMKLAYYGMIYEKLGDTAKANEQWRTIIDTYANLNFDNKFYNMAVEKLEEE